MAAMSATRFRSILCLGLACLVAAALCAACERRAAPRPEQPPAPLALLFVAAEKPYSGIRDQRTLYVVRAGEGDLTPQRAFARQGLSIGPAVGGRYVILTGCTFPDDAPSADHESFLYRVAEGTVEPVLLPRDALRVHDPEAGIAVAVSDGPLEDLRVQLVHVPSMRIEEWAVPSGLAESAVGSMQALRFHARMSPDLSRLALFVQPLHGDAAPTSSLVVLEGEGTGAQVLDAGLWPEWSPFVSWSTGPSLEWVDDRRVVYVDRRGDSREAGEHLLKMADVVTGRVRTLGRSPSLALLRDSRTGQISMVAAGGKSQVLDVAERGLEARIREQPRPERFAASRTDDRKTEVLRDEDTGSEIWRGRFGALGRRSVSPDGDLLAFTVRPQKADEAADLYIYHGRTGRTHKVFSGHLTDLLWVGSQPGGYAEP